MNIIALRLLSSEDLLCDMLNEDDVSFEVENPASIVTEHTQDGRGVSVGLAPYLPFSGDKKFKIFKHAVVTVFTPDRKLSNEYNRIFGSGIVLAGAGDMSRL